MTQRTGIIQINAFDVDFNQVLGKGTTSLVYKGYERDTRTPVAVKVIKMSQINNEVTHYLLQAQKKALSSIRSPYIIKTHEIIQHQDYCYIVMQYCNNGTLKDYIEKKSLFFAILGKIWENQAIQMFRKIIIGYISIMDALFIHRDLKATNILLRDNGEPVIIDFGYCQMIMAKRPTIAYNVGSPSYMSPETYAKNRYSQKSDIWSLGVVFYEMLTGKTLDNGLNIKEYFGGIEQEGKVKLETEGMSALSCELLQVALKTNPQNRATAYKLKYIIDKSMIPQMQARMRKNNSYIQPSSTTNISNGASGLRYIPSNHTKNVQKQKKQKQIKESISEQLKVFRNSQHYSVASQKCDVVGSSGEKNLDSGVKKQKNQQSVLFVKKTQNIPPLNFGSNKQSELNLNFRRVPVMKFNHRFQESMENYVSQNNIISLRIV